MRADALLDKGDMDGRAAWLRVITAIKELEATVCTVNANFRRQNPTWRLNRSVPGLSVFLLFPGFVRRYDMDTIS